MAVIKLTECQIDQINAKTSAGISDVQIAIDLDISESSANKYSSIYWEKLMKKPTTNMQSNKLSMIEAISNVIVGLLASFLIQLILYPTLGIPVSLNQNLIITTVFFVVSFLRSYFLRRLFNKIKS